MKKNLLGKKKSEEESAPRLRFFKTFFSYDFKRALFLFFSSRRFGFPTRNVPYSKEISSVYPSYDMIPIFWK